jgi:hypothetical protein
MSTSHELLAMIDGPHLHPNKTQRTRLSIFLQRFFSFLGKRGEIDPNLAQEAPPPLPPRSSKMRM